MMYTYKVDIIAIGDSFEAHTIRAILEAFHVQTTIHFIGTVRDIITLLSVPSNRIVIISCHGTQHGVVLPTLAPELEEIMPFKKHITHDNFSSFLCLNNQIVLNTGCFLGSDVFAQAFLAGGACAYIGSHSAINGTAITLFITTFFYFYCAHIPFEEAFKKAQAMDQETHQMTLYM